MAGRMTDPPAGGPVELDRRECLLLLSTRAFGRVVYTACGLPAVLPVTFLVQPDGQGEDVLVCAVRRDWLLAPIERTVVGLQADELDARLAGGCRAGRGRVAGRGAAGGPALARDPCGPRGARAAAPRPDARAADRPAHRGSGTCQMILVPLPNPPPP